MSDDVGATVKRLHPARVPAGREPWRSWTDATPLITGGVLDSIATLKLVLFIEERFGITLEAHEVSPGARQHDHGRSRGLVSAKKAKWR